MWITNKTVCIIIHTESRHERNPSGVINRIYKGCRVNSYSHCIQAGIKPSLWSAKMAKYLHALVQKFGTKVCMLIIHSWKSSWYFCNFQWHSVFVGEGEESKLFINLFCTFSSVDTFQISVRTTELFCESLNQITSHYV